MSNVNLADIATPMKNYGSHLDNVTSGFHDGLFRYWQSRDFFHTAITGRLEDGKFCAQMPKLNFFFNSRDKFILSNKDLISEVEFFTTVKEEEVSLLKCYLRFSGELTFDYPVSEEIFDTEYDRNIEIAVFNKILTSAYENKLISA